MTRRISSSRPMTGSSLPARASAVRSRPYFSSAWYVLSGFWRGDPLAAADALERAEDRLACRRRGSRAGSGASPPASATPRSRCSVETYSSPSRLRLVLGQLDRRAWRAGPGTASRPGSGRAGRGPRRARRGARAGRRRAGGGSRPGRRPRARRARRGGARRRGRGSAGSAASSWAATMASWAFSVNRSSFMVWVLRAAWARARVRASSRGSGWSTRSRNVRRPPRPRRRAWSAGRRGP